MRFTFTLGLVWLAAAASGGDPPGAAAKDPGLRTDLLARVKADQDARTALTEWLKANGDGDRPAYTDAQRAEFEKRLGRVRGADAENTEWLKGVVGKRGWPGRSTAGEDGANAAWLLVQHADADRGFQRTCLDLMAKLPTGEVTPSQVAYLTDRVLLAEGKKQVYGTQFITSGGKLVPRPIEDEKDVDKRRAAAGLSPLAEYVKDLERVYGTGPGK